MPRGVRIDYDLRESLPHLSVKTVFDVGANIGQSANEYFKVFPNANVYCFEPVEATYRMLLQNTKRIPTIQCYQMALGSRKGTARICSDCLYDSGAFITADDNAAHGDARKIESVKIDTIDSFCQNHAVEAVNYLKIDTEGHDLEILTGASGMLGKQLIDVVQVEAGINPINTQHVPFRDMAEYLCGLAYQVFGIYDQVPEWPTNQPHLRRVNAVFISMRVIDAHSRA